MVERGVSATGKSSFRSHEIAANPTDVVPELLPVLPFPTVGPLGDVNDERLRTYEKLVELLVLGFHGDRL